MTKKLQKNIILNEFIKFLQNVEEDNHIPRETKYVYFIVDFSNNDIEISYSADERLFKVFDYGWYMPLNAEHFFSRELNKISHKLFDEKSLTKKEVFLFLKSITLSAKNKCDFLKNYVAYFGEKFKKIIV